VLLVGNGKDIQVGTPLVSGGSVDAKVLRQGRTGKVSVTKFRLRQNYLRQHTHRQWFTEVAITRINGAPCGAKRTKAEAPEAAPQGEDAKPGAAAAGKKKAAKKTAKKTAAASGGAPRKKAAKKAAAKKDDE